MKTLITRLWHSLRSKNASEMVIEATESRLVNEKIRLIVDVQDAHIQSIAGKQGAWIDTIRQLEERVKNCQIDIGNWHSEVDGVKDELTASIKHQNLAIAEGIERVERAERRINATVARARKDLKEHGLADPGLEAEHSELRLYDEAEREPVGLQDVRSSLEESDDAPSSVKGVTIGQLRKATKGV